jgi:tetratricopeptide (TPR) repeat protein
VTAGGFFTELRRRRALHIGGAYIAGAWLATEIASFLLDQAGAPGWSIRLLAIIFMVGFPVTVVLAWVVQVQPDGKWAIDPSSGQRRTVFGAIALGIAATAGLSWLILPRIEDPPPDLSYQPLPNSVAIVPMAVSGATPNERTVGETLYHALLQGLNQSRELTQVRLKLDAPPADLLALGKRVRVTAVLTGRIRSVAGGSRVEIELLDVTRNAVRWSRSFEWDPTRIMETGTVIANAVLQSMALPVISVDRFAGTDDREAYDSLLLGFRHQNARNIPELRISMEDFQRAIDLDPGYVRAYVGLARTIWFFLIQKGPPEEERRALEERQKEVLEIALDLDDESADAISMLGNLSDEPELRIQLWERALELNPNHWQTYFSLASQLLDDGRFREAERLYRKALEFDPMNANLRTHLSDALWNQGRVEEAFAEVERSIELEPGLEKNYRKLGAWNHCITGNVVKGVYYMRKAYAVNPESGRLAGFVAGNYAELGMRDEALAFMERGLELSPTAYWAWMMAGAVHKRLGDRELAGQYLDRAAELNPEFKRQLWKQIYEDIDSGQPERALDRYMEAFPAFTSNTDQEIDYTNLWQWLEFGWILIDVGQVERGRHILEDLARFLEEKCSEGPWISPEGPDICGGLIEVYADLEDREATLDQMRRLIVDQHRRFDVFRYDEPEFDFVRDEPEFQELMDILHADLAAQRERVREMERNGEMPPAPGVVFEPR